MPVPPVIEDRWPNEEFWRCRRKNLCYLPFGQGYCRRDALNGGPVSADLVKPCEHLRN
jgi:hypothetical protein